MWHSRRADAARPDASLCLERERTCGCFKASCSTTYQVHFTFFTCQEGIFRYLRFFGCCGFASVKPAWRCCCGLIVRSLGALLCLGGVLGSVGRSDRWRSGISEYGWETILVLWVVVELPFSVEVDVEFENAHRDCEASFRLVKLCSCPCCVNRYRRPLCTLVREHSPTVGMVICIKASLGGRS